MSSDLQPPAANATPLSGAAQAYQRELARVGRIRAQLEALDHLGPAHQLEAARRLGPLTQRRRELQRQLVLALDGWLERAEVGLSAAQRSTLRDTLCRRAEALAEDGDAGMAMVHDRRSPISLAQKRQARADEWRRRLDEALGGSSTPPQSDDDPDALLRAAVERLQTERAAQSQRRQARRQAREARASARTPSSAQLTAVQLQQDAETTLRRLYRQLASLLHPDRETDPQAQQRKNALMSAANAAYDRKDLLTLMALQQQAEEVAPDDLARVPEKRLQALTLLLRQQAAELERARQAAQQRWEQQLQLPPGASLSAPALQALLTQGEHALQTELTGLEDDLRAMRDLAALKPWLNRQRERSAAPRRPAEPTAFS